MLVPGKAATITATNFDGADSNLITQEDGQLYVGGLVWVGTFPMSHEGIQNAVQDGQLDYLQDQFTQFGKATSIFFNGLPGLYQDVLTQTVTEGDAFAGQPVYTVISDQGLLRLSTELLIFQHDQVFLADPSRNEPALLQDGQGELIVGEFGRHRASLGQVQDQPTFNLARLAPIPEPSSLGLMVASLLATAGER